MPSIYDQLCQIADDQGKNGYLVAYADDLHKIDRNTLARSEAGDKFVWALRDSGTELFRVRSGMNPVWLTYWLDPKKGNNRSKPTLTYQITVDADGGEDGWVTKIGYAEATALANLPHPQGKVIEVSLR